MGGWKRRVPGLFKHLQSMNGGLVWVDIHPVAWWIPFSHQLAELACDYGLDTWVDEAFEELIKLFIKISKLN